MAAGRRPSHTASRRTALDDAEQVHATSPAQWRRWLTRHATRTTGVWLVTRKKATGKPRMEYGESVEEALAFGWFDSLPRSLDDERSLLWFAPRKPKSGWSLINKTRVVRLIADGRMTAQGPAKVEQAKRDGSWSLLDDVDALVVPPDLTCALAAYDRASEHFAAFPPSVKRGILEWIGSAQRSETGAHRVDETSAAGSAEYSREPMAAVGRQRGRGRAVASDPAHSVRATGRLAHPWLLQSPGTH